MTSSWVLVRPTALSVDVDSKHSVHRWVGSFICLFGYVHGARHSRGGSAGTDSCFFLLGLNNYSFLRVSYIDMLCKGSCGESSSLSISNLDRQPTTKDTMTVDVVFARNYLLASVQRAKTNRDLPLGPAFPSRNPPAPAVTLASVTWDRFFFFLRLCSQCQILPGDLCRVDPGDGAGMSWFLETNTSQYV